MGQAWARQSPAQLGTQSTDRRGPAIIVLLVGVALEIACNYSFGQELADLIECEMIPITCECPVNNEAHYGQIVPSCYRLATIVVIQCSNVCVCNRIQFSPIILIWRLACMLREGERQTGWKSNRGRREGELSEAEWGVGGGLVVTPIEQQPNCQSHYHAPNSAHRYWALVQWAKEFSVSWSRPPPPIVAQCAYAI